MRILHVITAAQFGGTSRHVLSLISHLVSQNHEVGIVTSPEPRLIKESRKIGAKVFLNPHFVRRVQLHEDIRALAPVYRALREFKPDLVCAHSTKAGFAARLCCRILGIHRSIFTAHGWAFAEGRSRWKRQMLAGAEKVAARFTRKIICVSEHDRNLAIQFGVGFPEQLVVIHNGIDPKPFLRTGDRAVRRGLSKVSAPVLTMIGHLVPQKDPITLLNACLLLRNPYKLVIVGDGWLREEIRGYVENQSQLRDRVLIMGESESISEILAESDIFVMSSRWEGHPIAVIEAMVAGLPVIATNVGGLPELVEDNLTGLLVPPAQPQALTNAIERLLSDRSLCTRMGDAGRKRALVHFSVESMVKSTEAVYKEVLSSTND
jgi:glycosyltransferase involved in cell wall biosynthesis